MIRTPPRTNRTDKLFPTTTLVRSIDIGQHQARPGCGQMPGQTAADAANTLDRDADTRHVRRAQRALRRCNHAKIDTAGGKRPGIAALPRSEEHTSELQSLMRISYAVFCLKTKKKYNNNIISN